MQSTSCFPVSPAVVMKVVGKGAVQNSVSPSRGRVDSQVHRKRNEWNRMDCRSSGRIQNEPTSDRLSAQVEYRDSARTSIVSESQEDRNRVGERAESCGPLFLSLLKSHCSLAPASKPQALPPALSRLLTLQAQQCGVCARAVDVVSVQRRPRFEIDQCVIAPV